MRKINPKILGITFMILSMLVAGGFAVKNTIAPGGVGLTDDSNPGNGGE
ncbi:MAG: hypothetical protein HZR80_01900 [Candidatus Heimdallarchaeota archaeon]